jgi:hypothetical protein
MQIWSLPRHAIVPVCPCDQTQDARARIARLCNENASAGSEDTPHFVHRALPQLFGQVVQDQTRDHDVEVVAGKGQCFGGTHLELTIPISRCFPSREVPCPAPHVEDALTGRIPAASTSADDSCAVGRERTGRR